MTSQETMDKILKIITNANDYRIPEVEKVTKARKNEITFNEIKERTGFEKNTIHITLRKLLVDKTIIRRKDTSDKRYSYYSLANESDRIRFQEIEELKNKELFKANKETLQEFLKSVITGEGVFSPGIEFTTFQNLQLNSELDKMFKKYAYDMAEYTIFHSLGLEIIFSALQDDFFNYLKEFSSSVQKEVYYNVIISPLIVFILGLYPLLIPEIKANESFQITLRFQKDNTTRDEKYKLLKDKIFKKELIERKIINENYSPRDLSEAINNHKQEIDGLNIAIELILDPKIQALYEYQLSKYLFSLSINFQNKKDIVAFHDNESLGTFTTVLEDILLQRIKERKKK